MMDTRFTPATIVERGAITSSGVGDDRGTSATGVAVAALTHVVGGGAGLPLSAAPTSTSITSGTLTGEIAGVARATPSLVATLVSSPQARA